MPTVGAGLVLRAAPSIMRSTPGRAGSLQAALDRCASRRRAPMYAAINAWTFPPQTPPAEQLALAATAGFAGCELVVSD